MSSSDQQFLSLDRIARIVARDEIEDALSPLLPPHPTLVKSRRNGYRDRLESLIPEINALVQQSGVPFAEWETRLQRLCHSLMDVMNSCGDSSWFGWDME